MNLTQSEPVATYRAPVFRKKSKWVIFKQNFALLAMCVPAIAFFFLFSYVPMPGIYLAFVNFQYNLGILGIWKSPFVGFENFRVLTIGGWSSPMFALTRNTVLYNIAFIIVGHVTQIAVAIMLNEITARWYRRVTQSMLLLPHFISIVVVGLFAFNLLNYDSGVIAGAMRNNLVQKYVAEGMDTNAALALAKNDPSIPKFYQTPIYWPFILVVANTWKGVGYGSIVYFASLMGISTEIMEAASIDGANAWQRIRYIMLPLLKNTMIMLILFGIGGIVRGNFGLFYNMVGAKNTTLRPITDIIETFQWRMLTVQFNFSLGSAISLYQSVFGLVLVLTSNGIVRKVNPESALF
ncbi:MAG: ABC transporter permease subunit [Christensenellales bacterium]|jgi:putative aldouronate transport system permease protein